MKPIDYEEMQRLLIKMYQELEKEYNEKINRVRLENAYTQSLPLLRQQFFSRLMTEVMEEKECRRQIKNLKLDLSDQVYSVIAVKVGKEGKKDILSELSMKETLKEALEKIAHVHEFGMGDKEVFLLGGSKRHEIGKITRKYPGNSSYVSSVFSERRISCGISNSGENLKDMPAL